MKEAIKACSNQAESSQHMFFFFVSVEFGQTQILKYVVVESLDKLWEKINISNFGVVKLEDEFF